MGEPVEQLGASSFANSERTFTMLCMRIRIRRLPLFNKTVVRINPTATAKSAYIISQAVQQMSHKMRKNRYFYGIFLLFSVFFIFFPHSGNKKLPHILRQ